MRSAEDLYEQIKVALQNGDSETACQLAAEARELARDDSRFVLMHGVALRRNGQNKAAEPLLRQIPGGRVSQHSLDPSVVFWVGAPTCMPQQT
mgnify:CR=1 FL=1